MCKSHVLHTSDHGCISLCSECGKIQVCFGTTISVHSSKEFTQFCSMISDLLTEHANTENRRQKTIYVSTQLSNLMLVFSVEDLENLHDVLVQASAMLVIHGTVQQKHCLN